MTSPLRTQPRGTAPDRRHLVPPRFAGGLLIASVLAAALVVGALGGREPGLAMGLVGMALLAFAMAARPVVATVAVVALIYSNAVVVAVHFHGLPHLAAAVLPLLLLIPVAHVLIVERRPLVVTSALPFLLVYLVVQIIGSVTAGDLGEALDALESLLLEGVILYVLVTNAIRSPQLLRRTLWAVLVVGGVLGALSLFQEVTRTYGENYLGFAQMSREPDPTGQYLGVNRLAGPIGEKNRYAQVLLVLIPIGLFLYRSSRLRAARAGALVATGHVTVAMALTYSRGAAVGLFAVLVAAVALRRIRLRQLLAVALAITLIFMAFPQYRERIATLEMIGGATAAEGETDAADGSVRSRTTTNIAALLVFVEHPVVGVGPGMFPLHYREYAERVGIRVKDGNRQAHNLYLQVAAESGLVGLLAFGAVILLTLRRLSSARRRWDARRPELADVATGLYLAVIAYLVSAVFLHLSYARFFWLLMALAGVAGHLLDREDPERELVGVAGRVRAAPPHRSI